MQKLLYVLALSVVPVATPFAIVLLGVLLDPFISSPEFFLVTVAIVGLAAPIGGAVASGCMAFRAFPSGTYEAIRTTALFYIAISMISWAASYYWLVGRHFW